MFRNSGDRKRIEASLDYKFKNAKLLQQALTRKSALVEGKQESIIGDFQRLEFLGDRVLNLAISDILYENHPKWDEGQLTIELSKFTNNKGPLAAIARELKLGEYLIMGSGEEKENKARTNTKVLSDGFEALIGAVWLDSDKDFKIIRSFLLKHYKLLGLSDFNQDYEDLVIKEGCQTILDGVFEIALPEFFRGREVGIAELMQRQMIRQKATKPLSKFAAALESLSVDSDFIEEISAIDTEGESADATCESTAELSAGESEGSMHEHKATKSERSGVRH